MKTNNSPSFWLLPFARTFVITFVVAGCGTGDSASSVSVSNVATAESKYLLDRAPAGELGVIEVRSTAKDQDDVVIVGRIGGSVMPWVEGRAAFSIVDPTVKSCAECGSGDCDKPWDYC